MNAPETNASPIPRGARPDAETASQIHLVKNVSELRATYQIRLLAMKAAETRKVLVLTVPSPCRFAPDLQSLAAARPGLILRKTLP
jgi:hypothetical protein